MNAFFVLFVVPLLVCCCCGHDFRAHDLKRLVHLRDKVDRLQLTIKTDRMKLEALQKSVDDLLALKHKVSEQPVPREAQKPDGPLGHSGLAGDIRLFRSRNENPEFHEKVSQFDADAPDDLRHEVLNLRKEVSLLKSSHAKLEAMHQGRESTGSDMTSSSTSATRAAPSQPAKTRPAEPPAGTYTSSSEENRRKEILWIEESWKRLQDLQEDLEGKCNVTVAMHDQQEVQARLSGLDESVSALQGRVSSTSARVAVAGSRLTALVQEEQETKLTLQTANTKLADLHNEVANLREDFNDVLSALPEGALSTGLLSESSGNNSGSYARSSLSKLQRSSVELLAALDKLQLRHEGDQTRVDEQLAELEYNVSRAAEDQHEALKLFHSCSDRQAQHEVDMNALTDSIAMLRDSFNLLSLYQNDMDYRLGKLETRSLTIVSSRSEPLSRSPGRQTGESLESVVTLQSQESKKSARSRLGSKIKHRRHKNKRKHKFHTQQLMNKK